MSKMPKDKRDKIILVSMGTVVVVVAIVFALIKPQKDKLDVERKKQIAAEESVTRGNATVKAAQTVEAAFAEVNGKLKSCEANMAPPTDMLSWLTQLLNNFRLGHNVDIPQFSRETPTEVGTFAKFPYRAAVFTVRGSAHYHDFGKFLADFENTFPYIRVQNIELEPLTSDSNASAATREKLSFKMELLTLVRPIAP
jgi:Tfp pilus assembly protein PilO